MAEVHIEYSNGLKFAPFNGGYPEHAEHFQKANLDGKHNLWYDVYDHNDPAKSHANWSLLPVEEYAEPWFPLGTPCVPAVPMTAVGSVKRTDGIDNGNSMQSFSLQQMMQDAQILQNPSFPVGDFPVIENVAKVGLESTEITPVAVESNTEKVVAIATEADLMTAHVNLMTAHVKLEETHDALDKKFQQLLGDKKRCLEVADDEKIKALIYQFAIFRVGVEINKYLSEDYKHILPNGKSLNLFEYSAILPLDGLLVFKIEEIFISNSQDLAYANFWLETSNDQITFFSSLFEKNEALDWVIKRIQSSSPISKNEAN